MRVRERGEFGLLQALGLARGAFPQGWIGPGDDTAVIPGETSPLLFTTDLLIEGVHFRRETSNPEDVGHKSLAVNLSDVAAMGGRPMAFTVALALPGDLPVAWVEALYAGLREAARQFDCPLVGGDTAWAPQVFLSVALLGKVSDRGPVLRSGARPGEDLFVSGAPGESALGLRLLESEASIETSVTRALVARHLRPTPRLALGAALGQEGLATAMIDVSDGLLQDLGHVLEASRVGAELWLERMPVSPRLTEIAPREGLDPVELVLSGGEDYELVFCASPKDRARVFETARACATPIRRVGTVSLGRGLRLTRCGQPIRPPSRLGFQHFGRDALRHARR